MKSLTAGEAARRAGLSPRAVRLYEERGLLEPVERTDAGYRLYDECDVATLRFIQQARTLGMSLTEVRDVLSLRRGGEQPCRHVLRLLDDHIGEVDRTIRQLRELRTALVETRAGAADHAPPGGAGVCHIIEHAHNVEAARGNRRDLLLR